MARAHLLIPVIAVLLVSCKGRDSSQETKDLLAERCSAYIKVRGDCEIPMAALLATPDLYVGTPISFVGFLGGHAYPGRVYISREAWVARDHASSVVLAADGAGVKEGRSQSEIRHRYVRVAGTIVRVGQVYQPSIMVRPEAIIPERKPAQFSKEELELIAEENGSR